MRLRDCRRGLGGGRVKGSAYSDGVEPPQGDSAGGGSAFRPSKPAGVLKDYGCLVKLRCRLGLHRWARYIERDHDVADRNATEWKTRCRDCQREMRNGGVWATVTFVVIFGIALWCLLAGPPLLGAVLMIGAFSGLLWTVGATLGSRFIRLLSIGRWNWPTH